MGQKIEFTSPPELEGERLDIAVSKIYPDITRSALKSHHIEITVNQTPHKYSYKLKTGDRVALTLPDPQPIELIPQNVEFEVIYSDHEIAVINKPAGLPVHPAPGHPNRTLVNGLLYRFGDRLSHIGEPLRPGIVHRLDMDTSGLMVVAFTQQAYHSLTTQFQNRNVRKIYYAIVKGYTPENGRIETSIGRSLTNRKLMAAFPPGSSYGKPAVTEYRVIEYLKNHSYLEVKILTGRTHQIRVHLSSIHHPIVGDTYYSRDARTYGLNGMALCAKSLTFRHPTSGEVMKFEVELPDEFQRLLERLRIKEDKV